MIKPAKYHFKDLRTDRTLYIPLTWKDDAGDPFDLTGYTARLEIKPTKKSTTVLLDLTTENGGITVGSSAPNIVIRAQDTDVSFGPRRTVGDLKLMAPSATEEDVFTLLDAVFDFNAVSSD